MCIFGWSEYVYGPGTQNWRDRQMDNIESGNRSLETLAWGLLFVWLGAWWGFLEEGILPGGSGALGVGLILLGLNVARWFKGLPLNIFSATFGALFVALGLMKLADVARRCPICDINVFALFLILLGIFVLVREFLPFGKPAKL